jgi:cytoskeletal protein CcmA (bactofilin family)
MFNKSPKSPITILNQEEILTILGEDFECEGNIKCKSTARIEGKITGDIAVKKGIILGEKGIVKAREKRNETKKLSFFSFGTFFFLRLTEG